MKYIYCKQSFYVLLHISILVSKKFSAILTVCYNGRRTQHTVYHTRILPAPSPRDLQGRALTPAAKTRDPLQSLGLSETE